MKTVFVLGAGFTRAFVPNAPLMTDNYNGEFTKKFRKFRGALNILKSERSRNEQRKINIERLMTRLDSTMPYDFTHQTVDEQRLLLSEVKRAFVRRLKNSTIEEKSFSLLKKFAQHCISNKIDCITFNYDDIFDKALWMVRKVNSLVRATKSDYWHPDDGYGFFCKPINSLVSSAHNYMGKTSMLLLKLHGSINWRIKLGSISPYDVDAIVHYESWLPFEEGQEGLRQDIAVRHLETEPFIVPPVLNKSTLVQQPILRLVWSLAYEKLSRAKKVVFIGYSFPITDIAASFLFSEALQKRDPNQIIEVVILPLDKNQKNEILKAYLSVFPSISSNKFQFIDASTWARKLLKTKNG